MSLERSDQDSTLHIGQGAAVHLGKIEIKRGIAIKIIFLKRNGGRDQKRSLLR